MRSRLNISKWPDPNPWAVVIIILCYLCLIPAWVSAETIYYVRVTAAPDVKSSRLVPPTAIIFKVEPSSGSMEDVWSLPTGEYFKSLKSYTSARTLLVAAGSGVHFPPDKLYLVPFDSLLTLQSISLKALGAVSNYRYIQGSTGQGRIEVQFFPGEPMKWEETVTRTWFETDSKREVEIAASSSLDEFRLAGIGSSHYSGGEDVLSVRLFPDGHIQARLEGSVIEGPPVPDSIAVRSNSYGWTMIANEPGVRVLMSVAEKAGYSDRELLVLDRANSVWRSIMIPGVSTSLSYLNTWVVGVVADDPAGVDYENRHGGPPIARKEVVLVKPLDGRMFTVQLADQCEVLWIQSNDVYYRVADKLYRARIENDDFVARQLLVSDPKVRFVHWAFSGGE